MEFRFVAYDRLGARRGVLPNALSATPVTTHNDLGTLTLTYDRLSTNHTYLDNDPEIALERYDGSAWVEIPNARFRYLSVDFDHLSDTPVRTYTFIHVGEAISGVTVYSAYGKPVNDEGSVQWVSSTIGTVVNDIWNNAVTRGFKGLAKSFTATHDSAGVAWGRTMNLSFDLDTTLSGVLHRLVALGVADYQWSGRTLNLYKPDGFLARDLTLGANPISFAGTGKPSGVDSAPEQTDSSNLATHVIVLGEGDKRWVFPTGYIAPEGRREVVMSYSGVNDEGTALLLATPTITKASNELKNTTRQFHLTQDTTVLPYVDYRPGDWAWVMRGTTRERMRIRVVSLQIDTNGTQGFVTLGDKIDEDLEVMYEQIQRITGGVTAEGTSTPTKPAPELATPKATSNMQAVATNYIDKTGNTQGLVTFSFTHDPEDTQGRPLIIDYYPIQYRSLMSPQWTELVRVASSDRGGSFSPLPVYGRAGDVLSYDFRVAAMSAKGVLGAFSTKTNVIMTVDTTPPPKPEFLPYNLTTWLGTVRVTWGGKGRNDSSVLVDMPPDFDHARVYQANDAIGSTRTLVGSLRGAWDSFITNSLPMGTTKWFALAAVDVTGNEGPLSAWLPIKPSQNVSVTDVFEMIGSDNIAEGAILGDKLADNAIKLEKLNADLNLPGRFLDKEDVAAEIGTFMEINVSQLTADTANINTVVAEKIYGSIATFIELNAEQLNVWSTTKLAPSVRDHPTDYEVTLGTIVNVPAAADGKGVELTDLGDFTTDKSMVMGPFRETLPNEPWGASAFLSHKDSDALVYIYLVWYNAAKVQIGQTQGEFAWSGNTNKTVKVSGSNAGASYVRLKVAQYAQGSGAGQNGTIVYNMQGGKQIGATVIAGGSITTDKIAANGVRSDNILAGAVIAGKIGADAITATNIQADAINAKHTLTGPTIQTEATINRGIKLTDAGLNAFNAAGNTTLWVSASTGDVLTTGTFQSGTNASARAQLSDSIYQGRPGLRMNHGGSAQVQPNLVSIATASGGYPNWSTVLNGSEQIINSSGRADLVLKHGGDFSILQSYGQHTGVGIEKSGAHLTMYGGLRAATNQKQTFIRGQGNGIYLGAGASAVWAITYSSPTYNGNRQVQATPVCTTDGPSASLAVYNQTRSGCSILLRAETAGTFYPTYLAYWSN